MILNYELKLKWKYKTNMNIPIMNTQIINTPIINTTTMNLLQLFTGLPLFLQTKIRVYYLSYGTSISSIFKYIIQNNKLIRDNPDMTLWNVIIHHHGYVKCRIFDTARIPTAFQELELIRIRNSTKMDNDLKQYLIQHLTTNLKRIFETKYESLHSLFI